MESKPSEYPHTPGICDCDRNNKALKKYGYICQQCHDEGWRAGEEMFKAIEKDPNFVVTEDGKLDYLPDSLRKNQ